MSEEILRSLSQAVAGIYAATSKESLAKSLALGIESFGFNSFVLNVDVQDTFEAYTEPLFSAGPEMFRLEYDSHKLHELDTVHNGGTSAEKPFVWSHAVDDTSASKVGEMSYEKTIVKGLVVPLPSLKGGSSFINVATTFSDTGISEHTAHCISIIACTAITKASELGITTASKFPNPLADAGLSARQNQILQWAAKGKSNTDIATITGLSKRAVEWHMREILRKLNVASRSQAAVLFNELGQVDNAG
ncbi:LuxR family transcriptional regulator [Ochrobactrum daejeonense]|uniref:HTH-type quorum sensing-dependent transcriptional regulator VjbR n=1 Tax=Brucella daejeonensis TaxID=659015 RepID=A0A7W9B0C0_9HYPH|nr:LuxR family transcriptional regulator [Brucella daejeonensis]MBB5703910.1 LuxR family transcriptional regulator [Brucella daejeonensis]NKB79935.1 hypothetical protein [Brucella daejeonensis]